MFTELGFICVAGRRPGRAPDGPPRYRYLIYPHLPVVALLPRSMAPVREYCVQFPDRSSPGGTTLLPAGDDVLAKWMTLRADEDRLLAYANVGGAGCQVPLSTVERDITRLERWHARRRAQNGSPAPVGSDGPGVSAPAGSPRSAPRSGAERRRGAPGRPPGSPGPARTARPPPRAPPRRSRAAATTSSRRRSASSKVTGGVVGRLAHAVPSAARAATTPSRRRIAGPDPAAIPATRRDHARRCAASRTMA